MQQIVYPALLCASSVASAGFVAIVWGGIVGGSARVSASELHWGMTTGGMGVLVVKLTKMEPKRCCFC